jgi:hypothetical protein
MYESGNILYFTPFYFANGKSSPKNKYFIVLGSSGDDIIVASLPTSKNHIPSRMRKVHGCINDDTTRLNCYYFKKGQVISKCGTFSFPEDTYIYGEQVDTMNISMLNDIYKVENRDYIKMGVLSDSELSLIKHCLLQSGNMKRKIKRLLAI